MAREHVRDVGVGDQDMVAGRRGSSRVVAVLVAVRVRTFGVRVLSSSQWLVGAGSAALRVGRRVSLSTSRGGGRS